MCPLMLESLLSCVVIPDGSDEVDVVGKGDMARNEVCGEIFPTTVQWAGLCGRLDPSAHRQYPFVPGPVQLPCPYDVRSTYMGGWLGPRSYTQNANSQLNADLHCCGQDSVRMAHGLVFLFRWSSILEKSHLLWINCTQDQPKQQNVIRVKALTPSPMNRELFESRAPAFHAYIRRCHHQNKCFIN